jgi:hypothetical protein
MNPGQRGVHFQGLSILLYGSGEVPLALQEFGGYLVQAS